MPSGVLQFTLGLASGGFLRNAAQATSAIGGLLGVSLSASAGIAAVFREIERGGNLKDLSNRTGETVGNLVKLEHAFAQSGVAAGSVPAVLFRFQKSLSGVGEMGENTAEAFRALGLSTKDLAGMESPTALLKIFEGLNKLDRNSATGVAGTIFGRGAAGDMLQLARDSKDVAANLAEAGRQAEVMARMADTFDSIGDAFGRITFQIRGVFLGLAESIGPALNGMLTSLANHDFTTLGRIAELSLTVGFEKSVNFLANGIAGVFAGLPQLIKGSFHAGIAAIGLPGANLFSKFMAEEAELGAKLAQNPALKAQKLRDAQGWRLFGAAAEIAGPEAAAKAGEAFVKAFQAAAAAGGINLFGDKNQQALAAEVAKFGPGGLSGLSGIASGFATGGFLGKPSITGANALERVGGLFSSAGSSGDHQRQTAQNTAGMWRELRISNTMVKHMLERTFEVNNL